MEAGEVGSRKSVVGSKKTPQPFGHLLDPCPHCHGEIFLMIRRVEGGKVVGAVMCRRALKQDPDRRTHSPKIANVPQHLLVPFPPDSVRPRRTMSDKPSTPDAEDRSEGEEVSHGRT